MKEFDYKLDYKKLDFTEQRSRKQYRIGRGEQGVLLVGIIQMIYVNIGDFKKLQLLQKSQHKRYMKCMVIIDIRMIL